MRSRPLSRSATTWCWRRWIVRSSGSLWIERLQKRKGASWAVTENPNRVRSLLTVYFPARAQATDFAREWGGRITPVRPKQWITTGPRPVLRVTPGFQIVHEKLPFHKKPASAKLYLPHGLAFGSGEHATTFMLLRALARRTDLVGDRVLDLGTGCGVLALAARLFGARKIVATDFDAEAIRTARQNEALNFPGNVIRWQKADVKRLRVKACYDLVLANLFSGILCAAADPIAASLAAGGELWMSGILRTQQEEVEAAYRRAGLRLIRVVRRGKWVMLQWASSAAAN